jgi:hypothetical protein
MTESSTAGIPIALVTLERQMLHTPSAFGLYPSTRALYVGTDALRSARFRQTDISIMYSDGTQALQLRESVEQSGVADDDDECESWGNMLSELSGIGAFDLHDAGPFVCGGPVLATLVNRGSGLSTTLRQLGVPETAIPRVQHRLCHGGLLLSVQCDDEAWASLARQILQDTGAEDVAAAVTY